MADSTNYQQIAIQKLGEPVEYWENSDGTLVLCKSVQVAKHIPMGVATGEIVGPPAQKIHLVVIDKATNEVLYEKHIAFGTVEWATPSRLKITEVQGALLEGQAPYYFYDVLKGERITVKEDENIEKP